MVPALAQEIEKSTSSLPSELIEGDNHSLSIYTIIEKGFEALRFLGRVRTFIFEKRTYFHQTFSYFVLEVVVLHYWVKSPVVSLSRHRNLGGTGMTREEGCLLGVIVGKVKKN